MKSSIIALSLPGLLCAAFAWGATPREGRRLVWGDEFEGASLDAAKWRFRPTMRSPDCTYTNDARTVRVERGALHLMVVPSGNQEKPQMLPWGVSTHDTMGFRYGYLEMRAKVPFRHGAWPSFWMQSTPVLKTCPWMSEIDIFEAYSSTNAISPNLHKWGKNPNTGKSEHVALPLDRGRGTREYVFKDAARLNDEYHVYGFEWNPDEMSFFVDGEKYYSVEIGSAHDYRSERIPGMDGHRDFHSIILNNEIFTPGHGWCPPEFRILPSDPLPIDYWIDWVRLWQKDGEEIRFPAKEPLSLVPAPRSCVRLHGECVLEGPDLGFAHIRDLKDAEIPSEGYRIEIATSGVNVASSDAAGAFYARQTLRQLAHPEGLKTIYPCVSISDEPAYKWRGVQFDDCRHYFGKETVKRTIELMAQHKMNVFHWHLTEDQGWRLEIPGYPELVKYGAVRPASPVHRAKRWRTDDGEGDWIYEVDGQTYGPFYYSESDIKEILKYAAERHVMVVPEIELPGHVYAALAAYPEFACRPENLAHRHPRLWWGIEKDVLCLGNDKAIKFLEDVLDYVCRIFPGPYVHIGGDECPTLRWKECDKCQARIKAEGLKDENDLQPWITRRFARFLEDRGKRVVGWDEYLAGDVPIGCVGMYWRVFDQSGGGPARMQGGESAAQGHDMVMCPSSETYFYFGQGLADDPLEYGGDYQLTIDKVYAFDPAKGVVGETRRHILGGQCCNWSEYTWNYNDLQWKMWPRTCAMAETLWLGDAKPGFADFLSRLRVHRKRLVKDGVHAAPLSSVHEP